jgi:hypothetical protein
VKSLGIGLAELKRFMFLGVSGYPPIKDETLVENY